MNSNTAEFRKRFEKEFFKGFNGIPSVYIGHPDFTDAKDCLVDLYNFLQQEISIAEKAKEESMFAKLDALQEEHHVKAEAARGKDDSTFMHHNRIEGHISYVKLRLREQSLTQHDDE